MYTTMGTSDVMKDTTRLCFQFALTASLKSDQMKACSSRAQLRVT